MNSLIPLLLFIAFSFGAAVIGGQFSPQSEWYEALKKPDWQPPGYLFGLVWTPLYVLIGVSGWLAWRKGGFVGAPLAFGVYVLQWLLNAAWSWLFFGLHEMQWALYEIFVLWVLIGVNIWLFWRIDAWAGGLLVPYWIWISFATLLNYTLVQLNR
ncbi:MAG: tryptophan-rich sensory protein [Bacteroidetes Order II. Incertae sedis bacterium]|nr:tryptophan-rich sensory protein [Bacteroidetes Order II. bacterium]